MESNIQTAKTRNHAPKREKVGSLLERNRPAKPIGESLLTLREAAAVLRLNPRTVREYVRRGEIEARIIGKQWRFRRADIDAFFESAPRYWDFKGSKGD